MDVLKTLRAIELLGPTLLIFVDLLFLKSKVKLKAKLIADALQALNAGVVFSFQRFQAQSGL